jgi:tryptophan-rich sensory protein
LPFFLASIVLMIMCSYKVYKIAAYLLIPYLLWGIYATILMVTFYFIN